MEINFEQHTIEFFFKKFGVAEPEEKAKLLPLVTEIIYEYNTHVIRLEKEKDEIRKSAILTNLQEIEAKIADLKKAKEGTDVGTIKSATEALSTSMQKSGEAMAKAEQAEAKPEDKKEGGKGTDGSVKDAEFTENK